MEKDNVSIRFEEILKSLQLNAYKFSRSTGLNRPDKIYNILNGRNKATFEVVKAILKFYPTVNIRWLLLGEGEMFINDNGLSDENKQLLSELTITNNALKNENEKLKQENHEALKKIIQLQEEKIAILK
jgi:hypothetical protein